AAQLLVEKGEENAALSALVELLKTREESIRVKAAQLLKQVRPGRLKAAVPALVALLKDKDAKVRSQAAQILGTMQSAARAAAPALVAMLHVEPQSDIRLEAIRALQQIGPVAAHTTVPAMVAALKDRDAEVCLA